ncbi:threonine--tRNA ligase [Alkalitalea saponilacus]|uniref:Threonine--tRNA ligase n=1 Tax=Alkalitalea saponilacus TaxID=889453 RepID=A0A1T5H588_9BACT|nr:threonine--tRNA ligase [Alkalitalea saponilacus]ASB50876.1 threonine--tRNA ligase [Alkalitalea saponilacus]SKC15828.1 threonyl-tRNA synthetase [Alkalitalea saponilacus]
MIKITLPDQSVREYPEGITGYEIAKDISPRLAKEVLSITVNDQLWDITRPITSDANINLHKWEDDEGKHAFWHSSAHLLAEALQELYPGTKFGIGPAIENGFYYDVEPGNGAVITEADLPKIEKKMLELARQKNEYNRREVPKNEALSFFNHDPYKVELIGELEDGTISFYQQGEFTDLCRGPHLPNTEPIKAIKVLSLAGAYWRGDEKRKQLTRIYGITFPKQKMLEEYLIQLEEAQKRDHRKIGKELDLFTFSQKVGQGLPLWMPKGAKLRERLETFLKKVQVKYGYEPVITPHIGQKELYITSGHYAKYGADSFQPINTPAEGEEFLLKPMNCPHHCEIYKARPRSYRDLPIRFAEFGTVYRYEQSGELHGLTRVRGFTQDDAHIFCRPDQLKDEFKKVIDIIFYIFKALDFKDYIAQISLRDPENTEKYIGSDENWEKAENAIIEACSERRLNTVIEKGEAAFYGPKLDFMVKDALGRKWQLGTIQVDYNLPERFELEYIGQDNSAHRPIMIHRAPFGSMERFVAVLIEHTAGKFPLWLTPEQAVVLPISEKFNDYAKKVQKQLENSEVRAILDDRNEKIGRKIRDNELKRIPYLLIVGEKESENGEVSVRKQGEGDQGTMKIDQFASFINDQVDQMLQEIDE